MLEIVLPERELYDEETQEFISAPATVLQFEHSLVSLSKWESEWEKAFLGPGEKSQLEIQSYIKYMSLDPKFSDADYLRLSRSDIQRIVDYTQSKQTATTFRVNPHEKPSRDVITSEVIYYWMVGLQIPFECQHWHLNRLLTLIKVVNVKSQPPKKMTRNEILNRNRQLNAQRRAQYGSKG